MTPFRRAVSRALLLTAVAALPATAPALAQDKGAKPLDRAAVEQIVREYILAHPEIILEAVQELDKREKQATEQAQADALKANRDKLVASPTSPVGGNPKGDVTLVEFFDYNCGYCKKAHPERVEAVKADGKVRVVYKEFPILAPSSEEAAKAALAAAKQGKYEAMHSALMSNAGRLDSAAIDAAAKTAGVDVAKMRKDMEDAAITREIEDNKALASALGIRGTPGFVVGDTLIPGAIEKDQFALVFASAREDAKAAGTKRGG
ncbi:DsbA family protein [Aerophototrophica crusticola]|uniref:DsbA family protein n=1 Tax=Aerophototrophica crusticola TaxID=1709002 RepID=A0A858R6Q9_9PROT|nr:DsbA family protein [Rhodospirillaceae bacterium B3]